VAFAAAHTPVVGSDAAHLTRKNPYVENQHFRKLAGALAIDLF
jgi:hypothetical protein